MNAAARAGGRVETRPAGGRRLSGPRAPAGPGRAPARPDIRRAGNQAVQRCCGGGGAPSLLPEALVQRQARGSASPSPAALRLPAGGTGLDRATRGFMERGFGRDLGGVRVHTGGEADRAASALDACAFTVGQDVYFASGEYAPRTPSGRRLLAHELTHTVQQAGAPPSTQAALRVGPVDDPLEREADRVAARVVEGREGGGDVSAAADHGVLRRAPARAPSELKVTTSANGDPCACLVFIHNEERNARATAELMHKHCAYNLAIISPDFPGERKIFVGATKVDPNELFPPEVAKACRDDRKACEATVKANAAAPTMESTRMQFFLAIDECSGSFSLPVVALHNNSISDTRAFLEAKGAKTDPFKDLPRDLEKAPPPAAGGAKPPNPVKKMKDALRKQKFDLGPLTETEKTTNIFRWCASEDIARCHIGDPDHPDNVVWVTNRKDFDDLAKTSVNVVMQSAAATGGESETDLSTLFLTVARLIREDTGARISDLLDEDDRGWWDMVFGDQTKLDEILRVAEAGEDVVQKLRYLNIETPARALDPGKTTAGKHRVEQYDAIVATLRTAGLHCCGDDPSAAEESIRTELETWRDTAMEEKKAKQKKAKKKAK